MNTTRQFWTLFKYQLASNPVLLILSIIIGILPIMMYFFDRNGPSRLVMLLTNPNLLMVVIFGVLWMAPEIFRNAATNAAWSTGTEFLLTRAVDRRILLRARAAFFYLLVLILPILLLLTAVCQPDLRISAYQKNDYQQILQSIPDSVPCSPDRHGVSTEITVPHGLALVSAWRIWAFLATAIATQIFISLVYPLKYRRHMIIALYFGIIILPLFGLRGLAFGGDRLPPSETLFFYFIAHQPLIWIATLAAVFLGQLWCERRFARFEH